jgi:L-alanine-DL-glutamate epimerase-like enolase superfamily enzyme
MKIKNVELFPIRMTAVKPDWHRNPASYVLPNATVIVRIITDDGVQGLGEAATGPAYFNQTMGTLLDWLRSYAKALAGVDPLNIAAAHRIMDRVSGEFPSGCQPARAGIDLALYDIAGRTRGRPVYEVLGGGYQTEFDLLTNLYELTPETKGKAAGEYAARGFRGLKVKVGTTTREKGVNGDTLNWEAAKLMAALEAVPETVQIDADANQSWRSAKTVVTVVEKILRDKFRPNLSVEQPVHHLDLAGHRYIRDALPVPVIVDEAVVSPQAMLQIVKEEAADRIVLKFNRVGGLFIAKKLPPSARQRRSASVSTRCRSRGSATRPPAISQRRYATLIRSMRKGICGSKIHRSKAASRSPAARPGLGRRLVSAWRSTMPSWPRC